MADDIKRVPYRLSILRRLLTAAILATATMSAPQVGLAQTGQAQAADQDGPAQQLEERGLVRSGRVWVTPVEAELQQAMLAIRKQDAELRTLTRQFNRALTDNNQQLAIVNQARAEIKELGRQIDSGMLNVKQINELTALHNERVDFVNALGPKLFDAEAKVNNLPLAEVQQKRMELRNSIIENLLLVDRIAADIEPSYAPFAEDAEIMKLIEELPGNFRLGPARAYATEISRLTRARHSVLTGANPINRETGDFRVWGIIAEKTGVLFTYNPACQSTLLSAADAEALGIVAAEDAVEESIRYSDEKQVTGRLAQIPSLRLGDQIFTELPCYILGVEDADLGSVLGGTSFGQARVDFQPQMMLLNIAGAEAEAASDTADGG